MITSNEKQKSEVCGSGKVSSHFMSLYVTLFHSFGLKKHFHSLLYENQFFFPQIVLTLTANSIFIQFFETKDSICKKENDSDFQGFDNNVVNYQMHHDRIYLFM